MESRVCFERDGDASGNGGSVAFIDSIARTSWRVFSENIHWLIEKLDRS